MISGKNAAPRGFKSLLSMKNSTLARRTAESSIRYSGAIFGIRKIKKCTVAALLSRSLATSGLRFCVDQCAQHLALCLLRLLLTFLNSVRPIHVHGIGKKQFYSSLYPVFDL